jgi:hypothetical protein
MLPKIMRLACRKARKNLRKRHQVKPNQRFNSLEAVSAMRNARAYSILRKTWQIEFQVKTLKSRK